MKVGGYEKRQKNMVRGGLSDEIRGRDLMENSMIDYTPRMRGREIVKRSRGKEIL